MSEPDDATRAADTAAEPSAAPVEDAPRAAHKLKRTPIVAVLLACAALVLAGFGFMGRAVPRVSVPAIVGQPAGMAARTLARNNLVPGAAHHLATSAFGDGLVFSQSPQQGTEVPRGSAVDVTVTVAPSLQPVPDVVRMLQATAEQALSRQLFLPQALWQYSDDVPIGAVVSQLPRSGSAALTGTRVVIVVSLGPGTMGAVVPSLVGERADAASASLKAVSLFPQWLPVAQPSSEATHVLDQVPAPGSRVAIGSSVAVLVSAPTR